MLDFKYQLKIKPSLLLKYLILMALVLLPLLIEFDAFAVEDTTIITISANKNNYEDGETILLTVSVSQFDYYNSLKIEIRINEILIGIDKKLILENGKYTFEFLAEGPFLNEAGIITVKAFLREATATTQFNFTPRLVEDSKQITENLVIDPRMQGTIIVETSPNNLPKVNPEPVVSKPTIPPSGSKDSSSSSSLKVGPVVVPNPSVMTTSQDESSPNILGILIVIVFIVFTLLIIHKLKKPTNGGYNDEGDETGKEYDWNKKQSENNDGKQEKERQRGEREKYDGDQKKQKQHKEEKQYTESNKTEFTVTESLDILNVHHDATPAVIKKAQREMVMKYHPDKHKSPIQIKHAEIMMKNINLAYEILKKEYHIR